MGGNSSSTERRSIRLRDYDYAGAGGYFITICTYERQATLGTVADGQVRLSDWGRIVDECWQALPGHYPHVGLDAFVIMPDHVHGIILLHDPVGAGFPRPSLQTGAETAPLRRHSLGQVLAYLKYQCAKQINALRDTPGAHLWQRNYYEHISSDECELAKAREYIVNNPLRCSLDHDHSRQLRVGAHGCAPEWLQRH